ncbi:MAG: addiction module antidote protein HigA family [Rhodospirillales bacterium]|nr:addiction module antidote protein HigA family [Rhodospirillales bacterium]
MSKLSITIDEGVVDGLPPTHPGEVLKDELDALDLSAAAFAAALDVPANRISTILAGKRAVTADTALRLGRFFGTSAKFWLNLQDQHDLKLAAAKTGSAIVERVRPRAA